MDKNSYTPLRYRYPLKKKVPSHKKWTNILIIVVLVLFLISASLGFLAAFISRLTLLEMLLSLMPASGLIGSTNIIVLGIDDTAGVRRSDTMIIVHIDPELQSAGVISIPRDTLVSIPTIGLDKINHAYAQGGVELAQRTASEFLQISIPYYIKIDLAGLVKIVDRLGGVTVNVEKRMYYTDQAGHFLVDLNPGVQKLSGREALGYVRFRHDNLGDFGRIGRQQKFLKSLADEMVHGGNILQAPTLLSDLISNVETNLNSREILGLAISLRQAYETGKINMISIPGTATMIDGVYYWRPDMAETQKIIERIFKRG